MAKKKNTERTISEEIIKKIKETKGISMNDFKNKCYEVITREIDRWLS